MAITTLILDILVVVVFAANIVMNYYANKQRKESSEKSRDAILALKDTWKTLADLGTKLEASTQMNAVALAKSIDPPPAKNATRVYAALLSYNGDYRLFMHACDSIEQLADEGKKTVGTHWEAKNVEFVDVFPPKKEIIRVPIQPTKREIERENLDHFVRTLAYVQETYAERPGEKTALARIIRNIKSKYAEPN